MSTRTSVALGLALLAAGCDEPKKDAPDAAAPIATVVLPSAAPVTSAAPVVSAAPAASSSMLTGDAKDVVLTMRDPAAEPEKTVKVQPSGSVTLFLPDYPGTVWSSDTTDKALGKPKEEVIPGFAPGTNGHQFKWTGVKAGQKAKATFVNKKLGDKTAKPAAAFALVIES